MIVNLPTWGNIANSVEPWLSGTLNTFAPAAYLEMGIAVGVGLICFLILAVTGALDSLLGAFGKGSDPMRGIPSGGSGMQMSSRSNYGSRYGRVGSIGKVTARMGRWGNLQMTKKEKDLIVGRNYLNNLQNKGRDMAQAERRNQGNLKDAHKGDPNYA